MQAESVLLEPFYAFSLEVKRDYVGRAMTDFERMGAAFNMQEADGDNVVITGEGPVSVIGNYQAEVNAYTKEQADLLLRWQATDHAIIQKRLLNDSDMSLSVIQEIR